MAKGNQTRSAHKWHRGLSLALGAVVVMGLPASAVSASGNPTGPLEKACVRAGTAKPPTLVTQMRFSRVRHHGMVLVSPQARVRYRFDAMPSECSPRYRRIVKIKFRYKTEYRSWATLITGYSGNYTSLPGATGNQSTEEEIPDGVLGKRGKQAVAVIRSGVNPIRGEAKFGCLTQARQWLKLQVKDLQTGRIAGRRMIVKKTPVKSSCR